VNKKSKESLNQKESTKNKEMPESSNKSPNFHYSEDENISSSSERETEPQLDKEDGSKSIFVKSGWLEKKGVIRHSWRRRWFILDTNKITYYKSQDGHAQGSFSLINVVLYSHVEKKGHDMPLYFNIRTDGRDFLFRCESAEDKADWLQCIRRNIVKDQTMASPNIGRSGLFKTHSFLGVVKDISR